jgi:hypothetical protein
MKSEGEEAMFDILWPLFVLTLLATTIILLRDDNTGGGGQRPTRNMLGETLDICSLKPMTGFYWDGWCPRQEDIGSQPVAERACERAAYVSFERSRALPTAFAPDG